MLGSLEKPVVLATSRQSQRYVGRDEITALAKELDIAAVSTSYCDTQHPGMYTFTVYGGKGTSRAVRLPMERTDGESDFLRCSSCRSASTYIQTIGELREELEGWVLQRRAKDLWDVWESNNSK